MKKLLISAAVIGLGLGAGITLTGSAGAQVSSQGGPIMASGNTMAIDQNARTQTFEGQVEVLQDDARLRADKIVVTRAPGPNGEGMGEVVTIVATGNVYYVTPENTMKGDMGVYTKSTDEMVITGDVILTQGQNVLTGNRLVSGVSSGVTTMDAHPTAGNAKGRVKAVIYPDDKNKPAAKKPAQ